jgi:hypothetical protein
VEQVGLPPEEALHDSRGGFGHGLAEVRGLRSRRGNGPCKDVVSDAHAGKASLGSLVGASESAPQFSQREG